MCNQWSQYIEEEQYANFECNNLHCACCSVEVLRMGVGWRGCWFIHINILASYMYVCSEDIYFGQMTIEN